MKASQEVNPSDSLIQLINSHCELDQITNKQMFGEGDHQQVSSLPNDQIRKTRLQGKQNEQIIMNNQDLFNVNYSKSVYINKINSLIEITPAPKEFSCANKKDQKAYHKAKKQFEKENGYYFEEQGLDDSNKIKLAKNRQSARDSRKRKKIYVELLEIKVADLSKRIEVLQKNLDDQNLFINHCVKILKSLIIIFIFKYFHSIMIRFILIKFQNQPILQYPLFYQNQFQILSKNITKKQLQILGEEFGVNSEKRDCLCNCIFNTLVDHILPFDLKKTIDTAIDNLGIFKFGQQQEIKQLIEYQQLFTQHYKKFELAAYEMTKSYEYIKREAEGLERLKNQLIQLLGPQKYVKNILDIQQLQQQIIVKEEEINQKGNTKFEL